MPAPDGPKDGACPHRPDAVRFIRPFPLAAAVTDRPTASESDASLSRVDADLTAVPPSQFEAIRQLAIAALSDGPTRLERFAESEDARLMMAALRDFGWEVRVERDGTYPAVIVDGGIAAMEPCPDPIDIGSSGLAYRLSMFVAALGVGEYQLVGDDRMSERTVADLAAAMADLGVDVSTDGGDPPVTVRGVNAPGGDRQFLDGGTVFLSGRETSQFHTAALVALAQNRGGVRIESDGVVSQFYVDLTARLVEAAGVDLTVEPDFRRIEIPGGQRFAPPSPVTVAPDLVSVSYYLFLTGLVGGELTVSLPGGAPARDRWVTPLLRGPFDCTVRAEDSRITVRSDGTYGSFDVDGNDVPFLLPTLGAMALDADGTCRIRNVRSANNKMTARKDRTVPAVLRRLGADVAVTESDIVIDPPKGGASGRVPVADHGGDHRIVMALALLGHHPDHEVAVEGTDAVDKSFPQYFDLLYRIVEQSPTDT